MNFISDRAHCSYERLEQHNQGPNTYATVSSHVMLAITEAGRAPEKLSGEADLELAPPMCDMKFSTI